MNYPTWLAARAPRWQDFAARLEGFESKPRSLDHEGLEVIAVDYRLVLSDLAVAQRRFPGSAGAKHVGHLVVRANRLLHIEAPSEHRGLSNFLRSTFPRAVRELAPELTVAATIFVLVTLLGFTLASVDPAVGGAFLQPGQIEGLARGDLWTDGVAERSSVFASLIATNNMKVALTAWGGGALLGLGSLWVLLINGLMLGAIVAVTLHYGMAVRLLEFISAHGPLELTLIVFAAAGGLRLGRSLIQRDDRPVGQRLLAAGRTSTILIVGCLPGFVALGLVEGFLSPAADLSISIKVTAGLVLELAFLTLAFAPPRANSRDLAHSTLGTPR